MTPAEAISEIIKSVAAKAKVGVNLLELERHAETAIQLRGAVSVNKGYFPEWASYPYPSVICLNVNDQIAHSVPRNYVLQDGDLLNIDCGIGINGQCGDAGLTIPIGKISSRDERLLRYAKRALYEGIKEVKAGVKVTEIGEAIYWYAKMMGFVVNRPLIGHGIGKTMHEAPPIPHTVLDKQHLKELGDIPVLEAGQIICIEPHITYVDEFGIRDNVDGWTVRTRDGRKSAMFEHMVRVTNEGYEVLTTHITEEVR